MPCEFGGMVATSTSRYRVEIGSTQSPRCSAMSSAVIDAAGGLDGARDLGADRSAVVGVATSLGDRSQRLGKQRLAERLARLARRVEHGSRRVVERRAAMPRSLER